MKHFSLLRALRTPAFALLWSGQTCSRLGDYMYEIGLAWWVLETTGSATAMATVLALTFGPMVIFGLVGGVAVDRYSRLHIMLYTDLVRGATTLLVAFLAYTGRLELWHVYVLSVVFGAVEAIFHPAYMATVPDLVAEEDLPSANALTSLSVQVGRISGPGLGAFVIALVDTNAIFLINAITFGVATVLLIPLVRRRAPSRQQIQLSKHGTTADSNPLAALKEGVHYVMQVPWLWRSIIIFALVNITLQGPYRVSMPLLIEQMGRGVQTLGILTGLFAAGYIMGGIALGSQSQLGNRRRLLFGGVAVAGLMLFLFGLPIGMIGLGIAALINGAALEVGVQAWINALQELIPRKKLGRVVSIDFLGSMALLPVGYGIAGWVTDLLGPSWVFALGGSLTVFIALGAYVHPAIRRLS